ncbi:MAG: hypothetical protein MUC93_06360 [Bacteroidales bacterium]|jgi:hypothetical protein|nr:hypothetical protein [Bacteroidales bacterium]
MKLIKPAEISAKIMTLIDEAEKELIIVSPYNKLTGWTKLINKIKKAREKGIAITWYSRKNDVKKENSEEVIRNLGITPILIDDLHAKIYMNETSAIFSSMNMSKVSDEKSIDLGYITTDKNEYNEIYNVFKRHILMSVKHDSTKTFPLKISKKVIPDKGKLYESISDIFFFNGIHDHILRHYGEFEHKCNKGDSLVYHNFIKERYKLLFNTYDQSIKVLITVPTFVIRDRTEKKLIQDKSKLTCKEELSFFVNDPIIKYYYVSNVFITEWGDAQLEVFLSDLDILLNAVFLPN